MKINDEILNECGFMDAQHNTNFDHGENMKKSGFMNN